MDYSKKVLYNVCVYISTYFYFFQGKSILFEFFNFDFCKLIEKIKFMAYALNDCFAQKGSIAQVLPVQEDHETLY